MKKIFYRIYTASFIGICLIPAVLTPFMQSDETAEKRNLSEFPKFTDEDGGLNTEFFSGFETWFSEHFAFRQNLVNANGRLRSEILSSSPDSDVIVGKDGWLFYGETTGDYLRTNVMNRREINSIIHNLRLVSEYCSGKGVEFIFFSVPNKNTLYPEYMPYNYIPADRKSNYENLTAGLAGDKFYLDMKEALLGIDFSEPLYHKTDTHWNNFGAYAAHVSIMERIGKSSCPVESGGWYIRNDRLGDLASMIYPAEKAKDTQFHNEYEFGYQYTSRFRGLDDISITTSNQDRQGNLIMFRDSFGEAILPYMAEMFGTAEFSRAVPYNLRNVSEDDTVIIEIVERNLGNLKKYAPIMPAPVREFPETIAESGSFSMIAESEEINGFSHIWGKVPKECITGDNCRIYVESGGIVYEAFNCFEEKLLGEPDNGYGNGFSLYLPSGSEADRVIVGNDDDKIFCSQ
ncbi:MAG: hypothetical protein K2I00_08250 [Ruminococcus sp.]|nr:hypothetical protein [Ruminococcus sp.]